MAEASSQDECSNGEGDSGGTEGGGGGEGEENYCWCGRPLTYKHGCRNTTCQGCGTVYDRRLTAKEVTAEDVVKCRICGDKGLVPAIEIRCGGRVPYIIMYPCDCGIPEYDHFRTDGMGKHKDGTQRRRITYQAEFGEGLQFGKAWKEDGKGYKMTYHDFVTVLRWPEIVEKFYAPRLSVGAI